MITVTESAVKMVRRIMEKENRAGTLLRVGVQGGGCSGFSYRMQFDDAPRADDARYTFHDLDVVVDPRSLEFLRGFVLDYRQGLNAGFQWLNPNATKTCSCGESFSVSAEPGREAG